MAADYAIQEFWGIFASLANNMKRDTLNTDIPWLGCFVWKLIAVSYGFKTLSPRSLTNVIDLGEIGEGHARAVRGFRGGPASGPTAQAWHPDQIAGPAVPALGGFTGKARRSSNPRRVAAAAAHEAASSSTGRPSNLVNAPVERNPRAGRLRPWLELPNRAHLEYNDGGP